MDDPSLTRWLAAVRAVHFAACLLAANVWVFDRWIAPRRVAVWRRLAVSILLVALPLALISGVAWFVLVAANLNGVTWREAIQDHAGLRLVWNRTRFGRVWKIHALFLGIETFFAAVWFFFKRGSLLGIIAGAGLLAGLAWAGHGDSGPAPGWHLTADIIHLLASAVWPAGLAPFLVVLICVGRSGRPGRWEILYEMTRRFSAASLIAVAVLTATGLVNSWCLVGSFGGMVTTDYGRLLAGKVILFTAMVGLGAFNLLVMKPRLAGGGGAGRMAWAVGFEIALGAAVITAVGLLGLLEPARM